MEYGMYERVIDQWLHQMIQRRVKGTDQVFDHSIEELESPTILSQHMGRVLEMALKRMTGNGALEKRIHVLNPHVPQVAKAKIGNFSFEYAES